MPRIITLLLLLFVFAHSCQKGNRSLFLRMDATVHNSNFPPNLQVQDAPRDYAATMIVGHNGVHPVHTRSVDVDGVNVRFRLTLIDMNQDQRYDEVGVDYILLSPIGQDSVPISLGATNVGPLRKSTLIQVDRSFYLLGPVDNHGDAIELIPWERCPNDALAARLQTRMKQIPVRDGDGEEIYLSFRNSNGKSTVLLVWSYQWLSLEILTELQAKSNVWEEDWEIVGINMNDYPRELAQFLEEKPLSFPNYLMTGKTCSVLDCHSLPPYAILLDAEGRILQQGLKSTGIQSWLQEVSLADKFSSHTNR